jgi:hypothetical protein
MTARAAAGPPISVIVATIEPWPAIRACLDRLMPQAAKVGAEVIVADGTVDGSGAPPGPDAAVGLNVLTVPGASVFTLRARASWNSKAPILAFTEDHCVVDAAWVDRILAAHRVDPSADMVSGPVTNGSSDGLADWANFLMTFAEVMPPVPTRPLRRTPPMSNASFQRRVMLGGEPPEGWLELVLSPTLVHEGRLHYDDGIRVSHVQPRSLSHAMAAHFHNGRSSAGLALPHLATRDWRVRMATVPALSFILFVSVLRSIRGRAIPMRARLSLPFVWLLAASHSAGEFVGLMWGEGQSAKKLN